MAFDLQEQEQIDSLKAFWSGHGKWIAAAVGALALGYLGFKGWQMVESRRAEAASVVYADMVTAMQGQDLVKIKAAAAEIESAYGRTAYAPRAAFLAAKLAQDKGDAAYARTQLEWVIAHAGEPALVATARLRLAGLMLDGKDFAGAAAQLSQPHDEAFDALFFDLKGDVAVARGDAAAARDAYRSALAKLAGEAPARQFIQLKLDALGV